MPGHTSRGKPWIIGVTAANLLAGVQEHSAKPESGRGAAAIGDSGCPRVAAKPFHGIVPGA